MYQITLIGYMTCYKAYINLPLEECKRRYIESDCNGDKDFDFASVTVDQFTVTDSEFNVYDAWRIYP